MGTVNHPNGRNNNCTPALQPCKQVLSRLKSCPGRSWWTLLGSGTRAAQWPSRPLGRRSSKDESEPFCSSQPGRQPANPTNHDQSSSTAWIWRPTPIFEWSLGSVSVVRSLPGQGNQPASQPSAKPSSPTVTIQSSSHQILESSTTEAPACKCTIWDH